MTSEFAPAWSNPRMTQAQIRKYVRDMKAAQEQAKKQLDPQKEQSEKHQDMKHLEDQLDEAF